MTYSGQLKEFQELLAAFHWRVRSDNVPLASNLRLQHPEKLPRALKRSLRNPGLG